ncbi:hypothetical protein Z517_05839 [Fonsecaea pedrosoi CBS 271.37]|uniref:Mif2/CENP-C cupin domain-containing protein n=1 Tax=Fonsecaea pedrosoi CBS 271.37 TaxID=1442368 RepID=A0A0D2EYF0_9EURO|nr:uncharacterized protein Z517_05839 [Fonsecaea pedrosoi CBS 271.37]KIW79227.1 hypothetical protein Z517_05839 [Fonsecaea pedrosoi CBS 271.37]
MAARPAVRRERGNVDYSAIGKMGRRTGITLDHRPLDANGMEEISGIFSSPRKPSPLKNMTVMESVEGHSTSTESPQRSSPRSPGPTPSQVLSSRRKSRATPVPLPRSSSPRKSGISGTAKKSNSVDIFSTRKSVQPEDAGDHENVAEPTPTRSQPHLPPRKFDPSPQRPPLRDITTPRSQRTLKPRPSREMQRIENEVYTPIDEIDFDSYIKPTEETEVPSSDAVDLVPSIEQAESPSTHWNRQLSAEPSDLYGGSDDEVAEQDKEPQLPLSESTPNKANSRKKRKSDVLEEADKAPSPIPKKVRKKQGRIPTRKDSAQPTSAFNRMSPEPDVRVETKQALANKDTNLQLTSRQQKELDEIVERVKARPGPPRSLYILRRETPADDSVRHTRSGRASVKPLAYWRNERCVYGASPGGDSLADGARFPLNSIKEIVRIEEVEPNIGKKKSKGKKNAKGKGKARQESVEASDSSDSELNVDEIPEDPNAEPWETGTGTFRGIVSVWDNEGQTPTEEEEEVEIAHAPAAIKTCEVKGSSTHDGPTFRYAKLLSTKFFGTGLVDLPPGGIKRPKNSRKMHMSFFVVKGRVTVTVGPAGGEETGGMSRFSIGKGGFWQVPRGELRSTTDWKIMRIDPADFSGNNPRQSIFDRERDGKASQDIL